jgi:polyketide synthase PksL
VASLLGALGEAWCLGATPDWSTLHAGPPSRVPLPTYDFEPEPHWVARRPAAEGGASRPPEAPAPAFTGCPDARGPLEREVAAAWHELIGLERLSVRDNFFDLGGDSLMATRLVSRLRERLGVELPLQQLLEQPTIEGMACLVVSTLAHATPTAELEALLAQAAAASPDELAALERLP